MAKFRFDRVTGRLVEVGEKVSSEAKADICQEAKPLGDGRYRFLDGEWIPLGGSNGIQEPPPSPGTQIIRDLEPYKPVAVNKHTGTRPVIGGRRQHRTFLRDNGYIEIGNDYVEPRREEVSTKAERVADIKRAMGTL